MFFLFNTKKDIFYAQKIFKISSHHLSSMHAHQPSSLSYEEAELSLPLHLIAEEPWSCLFSQLPS
jgi:hypothetical protein